MHDKAINDYVVQKRCNNNSNDITPKQFNYCEEDVKEVNLAILFIPSSDKIWYVKLMEYL